MQKFLENLKKNTKVHNLVLAVFGLLLLIAPSTMFHASTYLISLYFLAFAVINFVPAVSLRRSLGHWTVEASYAIRYFVVFLVILLLAKPLISILPMLVGFILLFWSIPKIIRTLKTSHNPITPDFILTVVLLIIAILLVLNPFSSILLLLRILGVGLIFAGINNLVKTQTKFTRR